VPKTIGLFSVVLIMNTRAVNPAARTSERYAILVAKP